ncbi:MAG TPA: AMP-binding protein [Candidatus Dormibacteraeota bacterium]|nr:AMP-binding protein [Candidatus Dormibacteraeota bacterium]
MATSVKTARTVAQVLEAGAERWADRKAIDFGIAAYTYSDLWSRARRAAAVFAEQGVKAGEPVLVMLDNTIEFVDAWLGLAFIGAIQVPVNTEYLGEILRHQVKDSSAWLMLIDPAYVPRVDALGADHGDLRQMLVTGTSWDAAFAGATELPRDDIVTAAEHDIVAIMYTSGTTGPSKGVRVAHAHAYTYAQHAGEAMQLAEGDVYFAPLPLFHIAGQWALVYASLQVGATAIVRRRFSVNDFWATVRESGASASFLLGAMANFLARQEPKPDDIDNPMDRMLLVPLIDDVDGFRRRFGVRVCTCYGSTEVNVPIISDYEVTEPGIAGRALPGFDIRIVDDNDREVPEGAVGELVVRASEPWVIATEYHRNPAASVRLFRNLWLHTGDAFRKDVRGNYYFVDRIKDYIRRRGENISSFEVEREVVAHPAVLECAAVAVKSASTEDDLKIVVVLKPGASLEPEELRSFLRGRVPKFMVPDVVEVIAELPKTPTGKIQKHLLRG